MLLGRWKQGHKGKLKGDTSRSGHGIWVMNCLIIIELSWNRGEMGVGDLGKSMNVLTDVQNIYLESEMHTCTRLFIHIHWPISFLFAPPPLSFIFPVFSLCVLLSSSPLILFFLIKSSSSLLLSPSYSPLLPPSLLCSPLLLSSYSSCLNC